MAGRVTFRVLFGGEDDARKLIIESGIPNTVEEFALQIKTFFQVTEPFRLQYRDREMDDQFMNLSSASELEDKATVKVVFMPSDTTSSNPLTRDASPTIPGTPSSVSSSSHGANDSDSYSSNDTIILPSPETRSCSWPKVFVVPRFSYCAEMILHSGNNEFNAHGTLLSPTPKTRSDILQGLAEEIMKYTAYPKDEQLEEVAKALIQSHPCLLEKGTRSGYCGWKHYLKIKMMNFRSKLSRAGHPEVAVNSLKNKRTGQEKPAANIKKPRKAEVNFCPNIPRGETRENMEAERVALLTEVKKKKKDEAEIKKMMQHTFSLRRQEVLQEPAIPEFHNRWPALFDVSEINLEFIRLTTIPLTSKFLGELDRLTDNFIKLFNAKGGVAGRKITAIMAQMDNNEDINVRRDCVLSCLSIYLNEDLDTLVKEYMEVNPLGPEEPEDKVGRVGAPKPKRLHYARDDNSRPNNKIWQAAEDLRQSVKPKPDVKRSKASLGKEQALQSPRKSLRLKEIQSLTLGGGSTLKQDIESMAEADVAEKTMGIYAVRAVGHGPDGQGNGRFADVGVVLEGVEVLHNLQSVSHACVMLYGLIYALNLSYPKSLKRTFEVYQKILMDLDSTTLSPKVQALKIKLLQ
ncbi:hypothetical protein MHYP_G00329120 [Metynnis hypsauchen]